MDALELAYAGIAAQARMIRDGEISSRELVEVYLERIERIDPRLNSFREVFADDALVAAAAADERVARGETAPLLGVPVAFKDELDIIGRVTHHGTNAYDRPAAANSVHVQRILDAGAIALGTTNLPELAICGFTESEATGVTRNPWDTARTPGGSSGGSAAAVAAGLVGAASASDGAGSIRIPAAFTGLVGLMPQRGRISLMPEDQHWYGMSRTGCLTRRVIDTALWLDIAAGAAPGDAHVPPLFSGSYVDAATTAPAKLRIATSVVPARSLVPPIVDDVVRDAVSSAASALTALGHTVVERAPHYQRVGNDIPVLFTRGIRAHYETVPHPDRLEKRTRGVARYGRIIPDRLLRSALNRQARHANRINAIFDDVDVLVTPVTGTPPVRVGNWQGKGALRTVLGMGRVYPFTAVWNYTGQPAMAIPVGFDAQGLPLSVMLIAPPNREDWLLSLAYQMETAIGWPSNRPPVD
ncbi:MAG TPA: amidase [Ilumatobacteraceae bacterium]|nr:amidase [Ilumatobacteraceae bacterium]